MAHSGLDGFGAYQKALSLFDLVEYGAEAPLTLDTLPFNKGSTDERPN